MSKAKRLTAIILASVFILCFILSIGLTFSGCSDDTDEETTEKSDTAHTNYVEENPEPVENGFRVSTLSSVTDDSYASNSHTIEVIPQGEDGMEPDIAKVEWSWRWDEEWIGGHSDGSNVYGYGYASDEEAYNVKDDDRKFLSVSDMSSGDVSVEESSSIDSYMDIEIDDDENGLAAELTAKSAFGCPVILTCSLYDYDDYADTPYTVEIKLDYDSVLGSLGTTEDWVEVETFSELEKASKTARNIRLSSDIESSSSLSLSHRTHLDLNSHMLSVSSTDIGKRARVEDGKIDASENALNIEGSELVEILDCEIEASETGINATGGEIEIEGGEISSASYGIYASGASVSATSCAIKSSSSDKDSCAAVYSASSASITISGGSIEGPVGAWAYSGSVTIKDSTSIASTSGDGVKAYQGTMDVTGATISSADSGAYCTSTGTVKLTSCQITGTTYATYQSGGTLTVSGGSLTGPNGCYCSGGTTTLQDSCSVSATNSSSGTAAYAAGGTLNATSCALTGYYGVRQTSGSIDIESCSVTGSSYGIYISGQSSEPTIQYNDFANCPSYTVYNSSSSRTVKAYYCYTDGEENDTGYRDLGDRSQNVYCTPCYIDSLSLSLSSETIYTGGTTTSTLSAAVEMNDGMSSPSSYGWVSASTSTATVSSSSTTSSSITVTAKGAGIVSITCTATASGGTYSKDIDVSVEHQIESVSVALSSTSTLYAGPTASTTTMTATASLSYNLSGSSYSGAYTWTSSNTSVATVSGSGATATITSVGAGTATVTCTVDTDVEGKSSSFTVTAQAITGLSLSRSNSTIYYGSTATTTSSTVTATPTLNNGSFDTTNGSYGWSVTSGSSYVSYSSSSTSTFTVTSKAGGGTATIQCTASFNGSSYTNTASITVTTQALSSISLKASNSTIYAGGNTTTSTVTATVSMNNGSYSGSYSWSYSNSSYISYSASGSTNTITAKAARGTATISCSVTFNGTTKSASTSITVEYAYVHSITVTGAVSGSSSLTSVWMIVSYTASSAEEPTTFKELITALADCYGTGSSNSFSLTVTVWDTNGYNLSSAYINSGKTSLIATDGSVTITITSSQVTVTGSKYTNGTYTYSPVISITKVAAKG